MFDYEKLVIIVKNKKIFFCIGIVTVLVIASIVLWMRYSKKDNNLFLYSDIQGVVDGETENITFSVDFGDEFPEDIEVELYSNDTILKEMNDNGEDGDRVSGDHIYSCTQSVGLSAGEFYIYYAKYKNKKTNEIIIRGFDEITEESYEHSSDIVSDIISSADKYIDQKTGYVRYKDVEKSVKEVCESAKKMLEAGEVLDIEDNGDSALIRTSNGIWYAFQPSVEDLKSSGKNADLNIISFHPWHSSGLGYTSYQDASRHTEEKLDNVCYKSEYRDTEVTLGLIKSLHKNQIILFDTHGGFSMVLGSYITTGQQFKIDNVLSGDAIKGRIVITGGESDALTDNRIAFTSGYVKKYVPWLGNSMVYLGACESFMDYRLVNSFIEKDAGVVLGYTTSVSVEYDKKMISSIMEYMSTYYDEIDNYGCIESALSYAKECNGDDDSAYSNSFIPSILYYEGNPEYRFYNTHIDELYDGTVDIEEFNLEPVEVKNDFYYEHGFDDLREVKVGEMINATVHIVNSKNKFIGHEKGVYQISKYYRFEGNETFPQKDGYEWCYYQYISPYNQNGYGENEYTPMQITDCLRYFESPIWKNDINDDGFYKFSVTTDDGTYDDCLYMRKDRKTSTDDVCNCWFRIPKGYDGITILHGCMEGWEYKQKYGKYPDYSVDLITDDTSFFRLTNY